MDCRLKKQAVRADLLLLAEDYATRKAYSAAVIRLFVGDFARQPMGIDWTCPPWQPGLECRPGHAFYGLDSSGKPVDLCCIEAAKVTGA